MQIETSFVIRHSVKERCEWRHTDSKKVCDGVYSSLMSNATLVRTTLELSPSLISTCGGRRTGSNRHTIQSWQPLEYGLHRDCYDCGVRWLDTAKLIMCRDGRLSYGKQLFLLRRKQI